VQGTTTQSSSLSVTIDTVAPPVPGTPVLDPASDTGTKGDNITSDNTPTFNGTGPASTLIDLLANNTPFGSGTSTAAGQWTITASALPNGTYLFTSRSRDIAGNISNRSPGVNVTIKDALPPPPPLTISSYTLID